MKEKIVFWHDVLNNSISRHGSNNFRALSVSELIEILKSLQYRLSALVYCHRYRTQDIFEQLKVLETLLTSKCSILSKISFRRKNRRIPNFWKISKHYTRVLSSNWKIWISCSRKRTIFLRLPKKAVLKGPVSVLVTSLRKQLLLPSLSKPPISFLLVQLCPDLVVWLILCKLNSFHLIDCQDRVRTSMTGWNWDSGLIETEFLTKKYTGSTSIPSEIVPSKFEYLLIFLLLAFSIF